MVSLDDITVSWGGFTLLDKVSFHIDDMDKIGLVGKNGAGKTTLMRIICGEQPPTSGRVDRPQSIRIGYLPQIMKHSSGRTVLEEAMTAFEGIHGMEREMEGISAALSERTDYESKEYLSLIARYNELSDLLSMEASDPPAVQAQKTLLGLGFRDSDFDKPTKTFSQGWNMRIELAKILLSKPDLMLLDEPTNHLDIESIEWLEDYLKSYRGAILLVSHDRRFLDNVTGRTVEILLSHIHDYKVPYSKYVVLREERMAQQLSAYENQQRMIEKTEDFIARFRYKPTKSNQVQSRIKALERLERIEVDETPGEVPAGPALRGCRIRCQGHNRRLSRQGGILSCGHRTAPRGESRPRRAQRGGKDHSYEGRHGGTCPVLGRGEGRLQRIHRLLRTESGGCPGP